MEEVLNGLLSPNGHTVDRLAAIAELYHASDARTQAAIALQLARVAITNAEVVHAVCGNS